MLTAVSYTSRHEMQHGYRYNKGTYTALLKVTEKVLSGYKIMEFDFKSFFNTITLTSIFKRIGMINGDLAYIITDMLAFNHIRFPKEGIQDEKEYERDPKDPTIFRKNGVPQGLSISPLVATMVLEDNVTPQNLVMYADDGLYFYEEENNQEFLR